MSSSTQRSVVVTGASSGIGRACALDLAKNGFRVFAGVRKSKDAAELRAEGGDALVPVEIDVTKKATIDAARDRVGAAVVPGGLDGLVNNAGIGNTAPVEFVSEEDLRHHFDVNVFGPITVTQAFLPLIHRAVGRIVNIGSVGSHVTMPFGGALCASKSALQSLTDALGLELRPFGIHVCLDGARGDRDPRRRQGARRHRERHPLDAGRRRRALRRAAPDVREGGLRARIRMAVRPTSSRRSSAFALTA